jgi:hypothetical protein
MASPAIVFQTMSFDLVHNLSPLQVCENALLRLTQYYKKSSVERECSALYLLFKNWHWHFLLAKKGPTVSLSKIVAPYLVSLCRAMVHVYCVFLAAAADCEELEPLLAALQAATVAGYHADAAPTRPENLRGCLEDMYNLLSEAIAATVQLEKLDSNS